MYVVGKGVVEGEVATATVVERVDVGASDGSVVVDATIGSGPVCKNNNIILRGYNNSLYSVRANSILLTVMITVSMMLMGGVTAS